MKTFLIFTASSVLSALLIYHFVIDVLVRYVGPEWTVSIILISLAAWLAFWFGYDERNRNKKRRVYE